VTREERVDKHPRNAGGDEHGEKNERQHQTPGRAFVGRRGCLIGLIFLQVCHQLVYGEWLLQKGTQRGMAQKGHKQIPAPQQH
jgi:hypothetical protein